MRFCKIFLVTLLCCFHVVCAKVPEQQFNYAHYTTRDGLAGETLYTITQDAEGFMWFATETGLSRFDGQKFRNFTVSDGLPANEVFGFYEDTQRRLWIKSFSNEPCYYFNGKIHSKSNTPALASMVMTAHIHTVFESKTGELMVSDEDGNVAALTTSGSVRKYRNGEFSIPVAALLSGQFVDGRLVRLRPDERTALYRYHSANKYFNQYVVIGDSSMFIQVDKLALQYSESWLYFDQHGQTKLVVRPERLQTFVLQNGNMLESYRKGGAGMYDLKEAHQTASFLPGFIINGIYQDKDQNIWFGTKWDGLFKLSNKDISSFAFNVKGSSPAVQFVHAANGHIFAGDDNSTLWGISGAGTKQDYADVHYRIVQLFKSVSWLKENANGRCINYNGSDFLHLKYMGLSHGVKTLSLSGDTLLIAASDGVKVGSIDRPARLKKIHAGRATCAMKFNGYYYVGTLNGLLVYDISGRLVSQPLSNRISFLCRGKNGTLWVSTYDHGIYELSGNRKVNAIHTGNSLLTSNLCRCLYYKDDNIWVGTDKGICKINLSDSAYRGSVAYNQNNGLSSDIINSIFVDEGMVYAGTAAGLNIFSERVSFSNTSFNLAFTQITMADTIASLDQPLILPHTDNNIRFDFSAVSFATTRITYQYRLIGLSDQWQKTTEQTLSFISLPSGKYRLQIQAINPAGITSPIIEKDFQVKQSVSEYWWVRLLSILIACAGTFLLVYLRIRKIRRAEAEKRSMDRRVIELEQMALRAQMNPHFIFNCLNSVQHYILKQDAAGANLYLSQFAGLVRQTLENSSRLLITLQEELSYLNHYITLERMQANYPFDYTINIDPAIVTSTLLVPNMIIQPFIENALKHGLGKRTIKGMLTIDIQKEKEFLLWTITDNGPGINRVKSIDPTVHKSRGLSLIEKRIETLNALRPDLPAIVFEIHDLHGAGGQGTSVKVIIPVIVHSPINS